MEQEVATFYCQHLTSDAITWRVNGKLLNRINLPDITISINGTIRSLSIGTLPEYNGTTVECVALFIDGTPPLPTLYTCDIDDSRYSYICVNVYIYLDLSPPLFCEQIPVF